MWVVDNWMIDHPGVPVTIYDVADIVAKILPKSFTPSNIFASFKKTGISPLVSQVFKDEDFLSSCVTDRHYET